MDIRRIIEVLEAEKERLEQAMAILNSPSSNGRRRSPIFRRRRRLSVAAKRRISEMMKKRWAEKKLPPRPPRQG